MQQAVSHGWVLDKLLTLSCNPGGTKALMCSIFDEPDLEYSICGIWLQGSFVFLNQLNNGSVILRTLIRRDRTLVPFGSVPLRQVHIPKAWKGAQASWWDLHLSVAALTDPSMSFIQEPISASSSLEGQVPHAGECRLLCLSHGSSSTSYPNFAFQWSGFTRLTDTTMYVCEHVLCGEGSPSCVSRLCRGCRDI